MAVMKTPGVYIVEKNAFANSVVEVDTAVPAFIGYTEKASNKGAPLAMKPFEINSLAEFETYFGGPPPTRLEIRRPAPLAPGADLEDAAFTANALAAELAEARSRATATAAAAATAPKALTDATDKVTAATTRDTAAKEAVTTTTTDAKAKADAKTAADTAAKAAADAAKAAPDDKALAKTASDTDKAAQGAGKAADDAAKAKADADKEASAAADALKAANAEKAEAEQRPAKAAAAIAALRAAEAKFASQRTDKRQGYVLKTPNRWRLYYAMKHFFLNGGGPCFVVSVGDHDADAPDLDALMAGVDALELKQEPTLVVVPDAVGLKRDACISLQQHMLMHCGEVMKNRFAILDIHDGDRSSKHPAGDPINDPGTGFRSTLGVNNLAFGAAYYPWVNTTIVQDRHIHYGDFVDGDVDLAELVKAEAALAAEPAKGFDEVLKEMQLSEDDWSAAAGDYWDKNFAAKSDPLNVAADRSLWMAEKSPGWITLRKGQVNDALYRGSSLFVAVLEQAARYLNLMPPAAAMAGVYTSVDNARGVWKAPANKSLSSVSSPAVSVSNGDQQDLNVSATGKSINAIRTFIGEGTLVWGARTLAGNSLDWRYINVRRTMIMLEESCRLAAKAMVFEPNVAGTWLTIRSMIENFLTSVWRRGGLAGAVPEDAFSVHVGLGETMTSEDILEGILRVSVFVAISRPAEFIEITFQQQMQKS